MRDTATLGASRRPPDRPVTFADNLHAEWAKLRTLRSTVHALLATVTLGVGFGVLYTGGAGGSYAELPPAQRAAEDFDPTFTSLLGGVLLSQLALGALGVLVITSEHATGMIGPSLTVAPRRWRVLAAKATVLAALALVVGELVGFGAFLAGQAVLAGIGDVPHATLGEPGVLRAVAATGPYLALVGLLGLAVGVITRSTAGGITFLVAATILIPNLGALAGDVIRYWPTNAGLQALMTHVGSSAAAWAGLGLLTASVAATLAAAFILFRRRDV